MGIASLTVISAMLFIIAAGLFAYQLRTKTDRFQAQARVLYFAALLVQSVAIGMTSVSTSGTLLQGPNVLTLAAWTIAVIYAFFEMASRKPYGYGAFVAPVIAVLLLIAMFMNLFGNGLSLYNRVYAEWPTLAIHIVLFFAATASFLISAVASGMLLYQERLVRARSSKFLTTRMPALSTLKKVARHAIIIGLPFFTAGIIIGFGRFVVLWGAMVSMGCEGSLQYLSPRITISMVLWVVYCLYLIFLYLMPGRVSSRTCSWISVIAGAASVILLVLSSLAVI